VPLSFQVFTIGLDVGLARFVGEANRAADSKVPLIGICPWGMVEGRQMLWEEQVKSKSDGGRSRHE